jgi:uncharacterized SAM-binding protein YcdF (DUF218 family)
LEVFFVFSKIVALALKPLSWLVFLAVWAALTRQEARRRRLLRWLCGLALFFTNPWAASKAAEAWEIGQRTAASVDPPCEVGILLGGYAESSAVAPADQLVLSQAGNRLHTAHWLYRTGKIRRILLSGGSGRVIGHARNEADAARQHLLQLGVPDSALLVENRSRNTRENALFSKQLLDSLYAAPPRCLLISSAWHLRRASRHFERVGLPCTPFGCDFYAERSNGNPLRWFEPDWKALLKWDCLIKEWIGFLVAT